MSSIRVGKLSIERRAHAAYGLLKEAAEIYEPIAIEQDIRFTVERQVADLQVQCDRERILQVFSNLLGNAFKFCRPGDRVTRAPSETATRSASRWPTLGAAFRPRSDGTSSSRTGRPSGTARKGRALASSSPTA